MFDKRAIKLTGLSEDDYFWVIKNYNKLHELYKKGE